jgi:hypothetical protein
MFTSSLDKTIRVWTITTGTIIKTIKSPAIFDEPILCMSLHSSAIAIGGSGGSVQVMTALLFRCFLSFLSPFVCFVFIDSATALSAVRPVHCNAQTRLQSYHRSQH